MVVAQLGLGMGAISAMIYSVVVFMSVATTMIAPPLIKLAFAGVGRDAGRNPAAA
jgi:Kef-type K+ transport system membrane component KefB